MHYEEYAPPPALAAAVRCIWTLEGEVDDLAAAAQPILPDGRSEIVLHLGDPFDVMGNQRPMHYNAMQKAKLAWIAPATVKTHAGGSATYTLGPLEIPGMSTYAVKIPTGASNRTYWLEFRQPVGFDAPLQTGSWNAFLGAPRTYGLTLRVTY